MLTYFLQLNTPNYDRSIVILDNETYQVQLNSPALSCRKILSFFPVHSLRLPPASLPQWGWEVTQAPPSPHSRYSPVLCNYYQQYLPSHPSIKLYLIYYSDYFYTLFIALLITISYLFFLHIIIGYIVFITDPFIFYGPFVQVIYNFTLHSKLRNIKATMRTIFSIHFVLHFFYLRDTA